MIGQYDNKLTILHEISGLKLQNSELDSILDAHPYFQLGLVEKSRRLRKENHIDAIKYARKCAILFPDRSLLYNLIHESDKSLEKELIVESKEIKATEDKTTLSNLSSPKDDTLNAYLEKEVEPETFDNEEGESRSEQTGISEEKTDEIAINDEVKTAHSNLEKEYLVEAINQSIQMEMGSYLIEEAFPSEVSKENQAVVKPDPSEVLSFTEWIKNDNEIENSIQYNSDLIDRFIQENPQISKIKEQPFYSPIEKGKESLSENDLPYSETLASIFIEQGNKELAIKAYKHLMLKNPQKSVYFADLINKLEEKI